MRAGADLDGGDGGRVRGFGLHVQARRGHVAPSATNALVPPPAMASGNMRRARDGAGGDVQVEGVGRIDRAGHRTDQGRDVDVGGQSPATPRSEARSARSGPPRWR